jgi:hypothetical protein
MDHDKLPFSHDNSCYRALSPIGTLMLRSELAQLDG